MNLIGMKELTIDGVKLRELSVNGTKAWQADTEKNYFDSKTVSLNRRIGSSGSLSTLNGMLVTDYIPIDSSMDGKMFVVEGITPVKNSTYNYYGRTYSYDPDTKAALATNTAVNYTTWTGEIYPWDTDIPTDAAFIRISLVVKDGVAITESDIAGIKITLK